MTVTAATPEQMLAAVERWARARGSDAWRFGPWASGGAGLVERSGARIRHGTGDGAPRWTVDPHTALAWALAVEAGLTVDVGRCPACQGDRVADGEARLILCPECSGTGRDTREVARLVLDGAPKPASAFDSMFAGVSAHPERWGPMPGDASAREAVAVAADLLQPDLLGKRPHDPDREAIGEWLTLWLAGETEGTGEAVAWLLAASDDAPFIFYLHSRKS